jgi:hypothetical protein
VADLWFSQGTPVSSPNKINRHDITEILLKMALNTITPIPSIEKSQNRTSKYLTFKMLS